MYPSSTMNSFDHHDKKHSMSNNPLTLPRAKHLGEDVRKPPLKSGRLVLYLWRLQLWFECTFGLTVMEPWERMIVLTLFAIIGLLVCTGLVRYFPQKIAGLQGRTMYYLWGHADDIQPLHMRFS